MKYKPLKDAGCMFHLVPALNHNLEQHPLKYTDSLVYGFLVYCSRKTKTASVATICSRLGLDRSAVSAIVERLLGLDMLAKKTGGYVAVSPPTNGVQLFTLKNEQAKCWQSQFVYDRTYIPTEESKLSPLQNAVFWRLVSLAVPASGDCGYLMIGQGAPVSSVCCKYLAKGLRCSRKTVSRALKELDKRNMIHVASINPNSRRFAIGILPIDTYVSLWRTKAPKKGERELSFEDLFGKPSNKTPEPEILYRPKILNKITEAGIPSGTAEDIAALATRYFIPNRDLNALLIQSKRDHARNRKRRPELPDHCGLLLLSEIQRRGEAGEWRMYTDLSSSVMELPEMQLQEYLNNLNVCSEASRLLYQLSQNKSIDLNTGGRLPVSFSWDECWRLAQSAKNDFPKFRDDLVSQLFPGGSPPRSDWLRSWCECDVIPQIDPWPSDDIPLPSKGKPFMATLQSWASNTAGFDDILAVHAINNFIGYVSRANTSWSTEPEENQLLVIRHFEKWASYKEEPGLISRFFE